MSKFKEQAPAVFVTVLLMGGLLAGYAYYVNTQVLPAQQRAMDELRESNATALAQSAAETRKQIEAVNQLLKDAITQRSAEVFQTEEQITKANAEKVNQLAEAVAEKLHPFNPLPKTPEEAEQMQNAQIDKVSGRLNERIQPILAQIAGDQNLTRESLDRYSQQITSQVSGVLNSELSRNERLGTQVQLTQGLAQESIALSHELTALYLSSIKDQGVVTRLLLLPANIVRDASELSLLNSTQRREKEAQLTSRLRDIQSRLDALVPAPAAPGSLEVVPTPVRALPTRPDSAK
ncbi:hypothetical protein IMCC26134_15240 [Verrucomicrobia bacterium IMCC26134]|jgi:hypothetical protein|nr:hypothetical protein IMCC26134_15240 [Verrucomicrobia bacterium IMCC26134]